MKRLPKVVLIGGGTFSHVRSHLSLAAPAFGTTVKTLSNMFDDTVEIMTFLTKMAASGSNIVTNQDVSSLLDTLIADKDVRVIIFNPALVDFDGNIDNVPSGKHSDRLQTKNGMVSMNLTPSDKIIGKIRKERKDIFVVGFKTTCNQSSDIQYLKGLELLKKNSLNLVVANDTVTHNNMIIAPEETRYCQTTDRMKLLEFLVKMIQHRSNNTFTRSTVVEGSAVDWNGPEVSPTLREVVNHCIAEGAYKPFLGKTAGHFATKINDTQILTSIRKSNYNELDKVGLVKIQSKNDNEVIAFGHKPSVGGQSQRIIFKEHPEMDSIVHFHCEPYKNILDNNVLSIVPQWKAECGSHNCGQQTSDGLSTVNLGEGTIIKVVYLDNHGPNIVFNGKTADSKKIIKYIDETFDLKSKTGGLFK